MVLESFWQATRYALAAGVTAVVLGVVPVVAIVILGIAGGLCAVALSLVLLASAVLGSADPPIIALFLAVALPVGFVIAVIVLFAAAMAGVLLFTGLIVLPISFLIEVVLRWIAVRSIPARMAGFLLAGVLTGLVASVAWVLCSRQNDMLTMATGSVVLFLACSASVGLFGLILTATEATRAVLSRVAMQGK